MILFDAEMPTGCVSCPLRWNGWVCKPMGKTLELDVIEHANSRRADWCPLHELPVKRKADRQLLEEAGMD